MRAQKSFTPTLRQSQILNLLSQTSDLSTAALLDLLNQANAKTLSQMTLTRSLKPLLDAGFIVRMGQGRAIHYKLSTLGTFLSPMDTDSYFERPPEKRFARERFNFDLLEQLNDIPIFSQGELEHLESLDREFREQKSDLSPTLIKKEFERVTIELSWKSSAIEGNTYSLLETETLLKEGIQAKGKKAEEARMILNHKAALEFLRDTPLGDLSLSIAYIEKIHSILVQDLGVSRNLRKTLVGITGTRYLPLDNQFQIREALEKSCVLINSKTNCFSRALLTILLISYIQPFEDGNKRCSRIVGNALLLSNGSFPMSFRSVDETEYKKAILLFYERNNLSAFKNIFLEQSEFSVKNYFRSRAD